MEKTSAKQFKNLAWYYIIGENEINGIYTAVQSSRMLNGLKHTPLD